MSLSSRSSERGLFEQVWLEGHLEEHLDAVYGVRGDPGAAADLADAPSLTYTKLAMARAAGRVSRAAGKGGGTTAPGRLLLRLAPRAIATIAERLPRGVVLVSATNGKTTIARMLTSIMEADGQRVVGNRAGANTHWGICTALTEREGDVGVFEVDEAWLPLVAAQVRPRVVVLGNLSRDRLDGYGELERLVALWRSLLRGVAAPPTVVVNADDPLLSGPGGVVDGAPVDVVSFGVEHASAGSPSPEHPFEGHSCARCGHPLDYTRVYLGHLGHYRCASCRRSRPAPVVAATGIEGHGLDGTSATIALPAGGFAVRLAQPGMHTVYDALAAAAAAGAMGVAPDAVRAGLRSARPAFGRSETLRVDGRAVHLCLVKNPASVNAVVRVLESDRRRQPLHLWLALNDGRADGRDVSWIWDADFERLGGLVASATCSGRRADELALRLKYAGWNCPIEADADLGSSFAGALARAPRLLVALPTYSALLGLRAVLNRRGLALSDWGTSARSAA